MVKMVQTVKDGKDGRDGHDGTGLIEKVCVEGNIQSWRLCVCTIK